MLKIICKNIKYFQLYMAILLLSPYQISFADDEDYLDALESEVESVVTPNAGNQTPNIDEKLLLETQKKNMAIFEKKLSTSLPATYHAYKRLNKNDRKEVVSFYFNKGQDMSDTTHHLFSLYFSSKNKHQ